MKKLPLFCILYFVFCLGTTLAYTSNDLSNAGYLAEKGVIVQQNLASGYRLDDSILRQEVIGMALKIQGVTLPENYTCKKYFADATHNDWVCRAVELAADRGLISRKNTAVHPMDKITRAEALAILLKMGKISLSVPRRVVQSDGTVWSLFQDLKSLGFTQWQADMLDSLPSCEIINHGNSCEDGADMNTAFAAFQPNTQALRAAVFEFVALILRGGEETSFGDMLKRAEALSDFTAKIPNGGMLSSAVFETFLSEGAYITISKNPTVALIVFSDLECPFCARFENEVLYPIWNNPEQNIIFAYKHFPLSFHQKAYEWALESECVREYLGDTAFFHYIHTRYNSSELSVYTINPELTKIHTDLCKIDTSISQNIVHDQELGNKYQIHGTPTTLVVNLRTGYYETVVGAQSKESVEAIIQTVKDHQ